MPYIRDPNPYIKMHLKTLMTNEKPYSCSDMEDCTPGTSTPDFQSILWSASGTPIQFLAIFYYEERMKIQNPFFKKDLEREGNPFEKAFP